MCTLDLKSIIRHGTPGLLPHKDSFPSSLVAAANTEPFVEAMEHPFGTFLHTYLSSDRGYCSFQPAKSFLKISKHEGHYSIRTVATIY